VNEQELNQLTDEELLVEAKKLKTASIWSALAIGIMAGVIIYSVAKNTWGFLTLIPLYFIYKMVKGDKKNAALKEVLKEKGLN
jgi:uncharacterized membrane protein YhiD involved in acid resistance